jgi:chromosome segregation ATPase
VPSSDRHSEASPAQKLTGSYPEILKLNQELVSNLQSLLDEHEGRKRELEELKFAHDQAQSEITRLQEELKHALARDGQLHEQLRQLELERVDQLGAVSAHLDALRGAVDRYLHEGRARVA